MKRFFAAFSVEALKARRSLVLWLVGVFAAFPAVMLGLMMAIKKNPLTAQRLGLLTEKSRLLGGGADWPTFLGLIGQVRLMDHHPVRKVGRDSQPGQGLEKSGRGRGRE